MTESPASSTMSTIFAIWLSYARLLARGLCGASLRAEDRPRAPACDTRSLRASGADDAIDGGGVMCATSMIAIAVLARCGKVREPRHQRGRALLGLSRSE